jgi:hypothetical protein
MRHGCEYRSGILQSWVCGAGCTLNLASLREALESPSSLMQASERRRGLVDVSSMTAQHQRLKLHKIDRMSDNPALVCCIHFQMNRKVMGQDPN